jgi:ABC-type multidrug transport system fused ATPase/permease subunit
MNFSPQQLILGQDVIDSNVSDTITSNGDINTALRFAATYLSGQAATKHPLCGNAEGWGPMSPYRWDFTPCFLDVWILVVSAFGIFAGLAMVWWLYEKADSKPVEKNWHYYTKFAVLVALVGTTVTQTALQIAEFPGFWFRDIRFWTSVVNVVSIIVVGWGQHAEHSRLRHANGVALFFWLFVIIAYAVKMRSLIEQRLFESYVPYFAVYTATVGLSVVEFVLEWLVPKKISVYDAIDEEDECPVENATIFSALTFSWMTPMMKYGYKEYLTQDDLWNLRKSDSTRSVSVLFEEAWAHELDKKKPSLWIAMFRAFGGPYFIGAVIKTGSDCLAFIQPQLLRYLIAFVDSYRAGNTPQPPIKGAAIALAMFAVSVSQTACLHQYFQRSFEVGMRIKASLTATIYSKAMRLSNEGRATKSTGDIVNHMAVDTQRLQDLAQYGQQLWSAPFQITLCMISLYNLLGLSMFAGVGVMVLMIPINGFVAKMMKTLQKRQMKNKDARTRLMTEILNNMKSIKLYAWTTAFMNKLNVIRNDQELHTLRKIGAVTAVSNFTINSAPFLVSCTTFAVFVATSGRPLSTDVVFPALTLFNMLGFPLAVLPMVITAIIEASVAVNRLTGYLAAPELQEDAVLRSDTVEMGEESVRIRDGTFTWDNNEELNVLHDINFSAHKGELSCVVGRVGSGKSSMLQAMLGDIYKTKGEVVVRGATAYVAQSPWVMNATVRENIIFGHRWDAAFYERTIHACALVEDFASLPDGDETQVGERGISLSGGQKARLTLARAVYARADIYLLDDVLSAVDQHVGRHIIDNVLGPNGLLASKTRILATNSIPVLMEAHFIVLLREGRIFERGTYEQLMAMKGEIANLIKTASNEESSAASEADDSTVQTSPDSPYSESTAYDGDSDAEDAEANRNTADRLLEPIKPNGASGSHTATTRRRDTTVTLRRASTMSFRGPKGKVVTDEEDNKAGKSKSRQAAEHSEQGKVKWGVYKEYAKASNLVAVGIYLSMMILAQSSNIGRFATSLPYFATAGCDRYEYLVLTQNDHRWFYLVEELGRAKRQSRRKSRRRTIHRYLLRLWYWIGVTRRSANIDPVDLLLNRGTCASFSTHYPSLKAVANGFFPIPKSLASGNPG